MARPNGRVTDDIVGAVAGAVQPADPTGVVVALGGGADSACLLAAACAATDVPVRGVFVDHALEASAELRRAAESLAELLDVPLDAVEAPVVDGPDLESRARSIRYAAIEGTLGPTDVALTAHTRDDQAETVLMRLASGAGTTGLAGIPAARGRLLRPLLRFTKAELRAEADRLDLPYVDDPANRDDRFLRSRIRHRVVPVIHAELGDHASAGLARSAELLARDDRRLDLLAEWIPIRVDDDGVYIPTAPLVTEDPAVASRACRRALRRLGGHDHRGSSADVAAVLDTAATGTTHALTGDWLSVLEGPHVRIGRLPRPVQDPVHLELGGTVEWHGTTWRAHVDDGRPIVIGGRFTPISLACAPDGIWLRGARAGDRLDIESGSTPVVELLRVHGVPSGRRPVSPVAEIDGRIVAVVGVRTAAWARPTAGSQRVLIERGVAA